MQNGLESAQEPKASRVRVYQAADRILQSGRRPTVEGVREILHGRPRNSVTAYINDWYGKLGGRLAVQVFDPVGLRIIVSRGSIAFRGRDKHCCPHPAQTPPRCAVRADQPVVVTQPRIRKP